MIRLMKRFIIMSSIKLSNVFKNKYENILNTQSMNNKKEEFESNSVKT